jgi:predicted solute-binding protein
MHDQGWFHWDENRKGLPVCLGERNVSEKKVQQEKKRAKREQHSSPIKAASRQPREISDKRRGDSLEARFLAENVKRTDRRVTRETAAQNGNLILEPYGKIIAITPDKERTGRQKEISKKG